MPFIDTQLEHEMRRLESANLEVVGEMTKISKATKRRRLIAVAILSDMERQGRTLAVVVRPYAYEHMIIRGRVEIPTGFVTDFASIPSAVQFLIQPFGRHAPAAVIHDYLYAIGADGRRKQADKVFLEAMKDNGVSFFRRSLMFRMVRWFGGKGYGLVEDWSFVDHETGAPVETALVRPEIDYLTQDEFKAAKKAAKTATAKA
ncbi:MAG: DUF1353 domain-containing protein [Pseudomonadota bacterium]